jgi:flavin-dependent dehydrogenase
MCSKMPTARPRSLTCCAQDHAQRGNYIISLGNLCRWLAQQAENLGVEIYPGFAAQEALFDENGVVAASSPATWASTAKATRKKACTPRAWNCAASTPVRRRLPWPYRQATDQALQPGQRADAQHYGIGLKEIWEIDPAKHEQGLVVHTAGWPLDIMSTENTGGSFLYHLENNQVVVGLIVDLSYANPYLSPFDEFQRLKHHPVLASTSKAASASATAPAPWQRRPELAAENGLQGRRADRLRPGHPELGQDQGQPHRDEVRHARRRSRGRRLFAGSEGGDD